MQGFGSNGMQGNNPPWNVPTVGSAKPQKTFKPKGNQVRNTGTQMGGQQQTTKNGIFGQQVQQHVGFGQQTGVFQQNQPHQNKPKSQFSQQFQNQKQGFKTHTQGIGAQGIFGNQMNQTQHTPNFHQAQTGSTAGGFQKSKKQKQNATTSQNNGQNFGSTLNKQNSQSAAFGNSNPLQKSGAFGTSSFGNQGMQQQQYAGIIPKNTQGSISGFGQKPQNKKQGKGSQGKGAQSPWNQFQQQPQTPFGGFAQQQTPSNTQSQGLTKAGFGLNQSTPNVETQGFGKGANFGQKTQSAFGQNKAQSNAELGNNGFGKDSTTTQKQELPKTGFGFGNNQSQNQGFGLQHGQQKQPQTNSSFNKDSKMQALSANFFGDQQNQPQKHFGERNEKQPQADIQKQRSDWRAQNQQTSAPTQPCKFYLESGRCKYQDKCHFRHDIDTSLLKNMIANAQMTGEFDSSALMQGGSYRPSRANKICTFFQTDSCAKGEQCSFIHQKQGESMPVTTSGPMSRPPPRTLIGEKQSKPDENQIKEQFEQLQKQKREARFARQSQEPQDLSDIQVRNSVKEADDEEVKIQQVPRPKKTLRIGQSTSRERSSEKAGKHQSRPTQKIAIAKPSTFGLKDPGGKFFDPSFQEKAILHYIETLDMIKESEKVKKYFAKAKCLGMCSEEEIRIRTEEERGAINNFELDRNMQNFKHLAVKRFERSAANKVLNVPEIIRSPIILYHTVSFLRDCIADQDKLAPGQSYFAYQSGTKMHTYSSIYCYMRDRLRQVEQDLTILDDSANIYNIRCKEEIVRFLILSYSDGFQQDGFDLQQNNERLTGNLGSLNSSYGEAKALLANGKITVEEYQNLTKNRAEMLSYNIIATAGVLEGIQAVISIMEEFTRDERALIEEALMIQQVIKNNNFVKYFQILRKGLTNYFFSCIMLVAMAQNRKKGIIQVLLGGYRHQEVDFGFLAKQFMFPTEEDAKSYFEAAGYIYTQNPKGGVSLQKSQEQDKLPKWRQSGPFTNIQEMTGSILRQRLIKEGLSAIVDKRDDLPNQLFSADELINLEKITLTKPVPQDNKDVEERERLRKIREAELRQKEKEEEEMRQRMVREAEEQRIEEERRKQEEQKVLEQQ